MAANQVDMGGNDLIVNGLYVGATGPGQAGTALAGSELSLIDGLTVGTVTASKAVTVDANKDAASFRDVTVRKLKVGDSANDHTITLEGAGNESANRTLSIPLLAGNDTLVTLATAQAVTGVKTMSGANVITFAPTGLKLQDSNSSHAVTIAAGDEVADRTLSIPVLGAADIISTLGTAQTITGVKTFNADPVLGAGVTLNLDSETGTFSTNAVTITKRAAKLTTESLTTAGGASQALVVTLTGVAATDLVFVSRAGGTNSATQNYSINAVCTTNTVTITVYNNTAATSLNGTLILNVWILKA